jgi:hypothetical protein
MGFGLPLTRTGRHLADLDARLEVRFVDLFVMANLEWCVRASRLRAGPSGEVKWTNCEHF